MKTDCLTNRTSPYDYASDKTQYQSQCVYCSVMFRGNRNRTVCYHCHVENLLAQSNDVIQVLANRMEKSGAYSKGSLLSAVEWIKWGWNKIKELDK